MCFSPTASFVAGASLIGTGAVAVNKSRMSPLLPLAVIPLLFGIQQLLEGFVWLVLLDRVDLPIEALTTGFLFFAYIFWPAYIPWAIFAVEPNHHKQSWLASFGALGAAVAFYLAYLMFTQDIVPVIVHHSIRYQTVLPYPELILAVYVLATCGSALLSSHRLIRWFSVAVFLSLVLSLYFFYTASASVWCFFAAIISLVLAVFVINSSRSVRSLD